MDFSKQIRTLALGAALTFSVAGMPALHAFAAAPTAAPAGGTPLHVTLSPVVTADTPVQGGATSQGAAAGTATDDGCQMVADIINGYLGAAQNELNSNGMTDRWNSLTNAAKTAQDAGEDAGCFFVNPM